MAVFNFGGFHEMAQHARGSIVRRWSSIGAAMLLVGSVSLVSMTAISSATAKKAPFLVGTVQPLTGVYASAGLDIVHALNAQAAILNAKGGINGRQIKVIATDDAGDPQKAITAAQQMLSTKKLNMFEPDVIFGNTQLPFAKNVLTIDICAAPDCGNGAKYSNVFSLNPPSANQVPSVLAYAASVGDTKVGVIATTDAAGTAFSADVTADAAHAHVTITQEVSFDPAATDVTAQLESLKASGAQVVAAWAAGTSVATVMQGMQSIGWTAPVVGTPTVFTAPVNQIIPTAVQSQLLCMCYAVGVRQGASVPSYLKLLAAKTAKYGPIASMMVVALSADTLTLAKYGYTKAGLKATAKTAALAIQKIGSAKPYPATSFYSYRTVNPNFSRTVHSPANANLGKGFFSIATVSPIVDGTYLGKPFSYK